MPRCSVQHPYIPNGAPLQQSEEWDVALRSGLWGHQLWYGPGCSREAAGLVRQHWQSENQGHWVCDVTCDEDCAAVRCGSIPPVMAVGRNIALGLMHWAGETNMTAACRRFAAQP
jgi:hypothetical protein